MVNFNKIKDYNEKYNSNIQNKEIENEIVTKGLYEACLSQQKISEIKSDFTLELPETKLYDQKDSFTCWIVATLDFMKNHVAHNLKIDNCKFDLSVNYIQFFHRLEKMNMLYEIIINNYISIKEINDKDLVNKYIGIFGTFDSITEIIEKYGIVPEDVMPMTINNFKNPNIVDKLLKEKVRKDILKILELKERNNNELALYKEKILEENYEILSKIFGNPPIKFNYNYTDLDNKEVNLRNITPLEFSEKYITQDLNAYILVKNDNTKEFYKKYDVEDKIKSIYNKRFEYLNLPIEEMKKLVLKQLKDGLPVWFGCDLKTVSGTYDNHAGILDQNLYDYKKMLGIEILSKEDKLKFNDITYQHAMLICGVKLSNDKIISWKVKNSYGDKYNQNGYFVMTDDYFNNFVIMIQINEEYLSKE